MALLKISKNAFAINTGGGGGGTGAVDSVNGLTGNVIITPDIIGAISGNEKGTNDGVAELDATGKVPLNQLPRYPQPYTLVTAATTELEPNKNYAIDVTDNVNKTLNIPDGVFVDGDTLQISCIGGDETTTAEVSIIVFSETWFNQPITVRTLKLFRGQSTLIQKIDGVMTPLRATGESLTPEGVIRKAEKTKGANK